MTVNPPRPDDEDAPTARGATHTPEGKELRGLWDKYRAGHDTDTRNELTEFYFDMVRAHSENIAKILMEAIEENDLYQAGALAFFEAMNKFDPAANGTFEEYGSNVIRHAIVEEIRQLVGTEADPA